MATVVVIVINADVVLCSRTCLLSSSNRSCLAMHCLSHTDSNIRRCMLLHTSAFVYLPCGCFMLAARTSCDKGSQYLARLLVNVNKLSNLFCYFQTYFARTYEALGCQVVSRRRCPCQSLKTRHTFTFIRLLVSLAVSFILSDIMFRDN